MEAQTGFRKNTGTIDNIFILHGVINHMLNGKKYMLLLLIILRLLTMLLGKIYGISLWTIELEVK